MNKLIDLNPEIFVLAIYAYMMLDWQLTREAKEVKVRFLSLPRNGNCLTNPQTEPGRLPFLETILAGGERWGRKG